MTRVLLAIILLTFACDVAWAADAPVVWIVQSGDSELYNAFTTSLRDTLQEQNPDAHIQVSRVDSPRPEMSPPDLLITVGVEAANHWIDKSGRPPLLATMVPEVSYRRILKGKQSSGPVTALYIDQPATRMLGLVRAALPGAKRVAILFGPFSAQVAPEYFQAADQLGLELRTRTLTEDQEDPLPALEDLLKRSDALLALPDPEVYNGLTVRPLLLTTFHERIPVFGYSAALVHAGAIAAVYSPPEELGRDAAGMAAKFLAAGGKLPAPRFPRQYVLSTNSEVAYSLQLSLPVPQQLHEHLEDLLAP